MRPVRLMTLNPGHFHAALVQKEADPAVDPRVHVYAPLGPDLLAHLGRLAGFNSRAKDPTRWQVEVHTGPDWLGRALAEKPGNVVVLAGFNRDKIHALHAAVEAGLHVLADKPWILSSSDLPKLRSALDLAERKGVVAYDIMTERFEITSLLQRALVNDPDVFGEVIPGNVEEPGVFMESKHFIVKTVAAVPSRRPNWYFDVAQQGEGLSDVGTHLVDLVPWILYPDQALDPAADVALVAARRWPTVLTRDEYRRVTGDDDFAPFLADAVRDGRLDYYCNTLVSYTLCGVHVKLNVLWDYEAEDGSGDTHFAVFRGSRSRVEVRQDRAQNYRPELFVVPSASGGDVAAAVRRRVEALQEQYPGVGMVDLHGEVQVTIPAVYRTGHEAHFGEVARVFFNYLKDPKALPSREKPNMLAKYRVTTEGVELARAAPVRPLAE